MLGKASLRHAGPVYFSVFAIATAFTAYFSMYAFRKPFSVATFAGQTVGSDAFTVDFKIALVLSQVLGYALSKFIGIKFVSELARRHRAWALLGMIAIAELALVAFAVAGPRGKLVALFFNGLPLGVVWGLVFSYLEGRRVSEILGAGLSTSYIVASGVVKSVGAWVLAQGVSESWMPAVTGSLFVPTFGLAVWGLNSLPMPTEQDVRSRTQREPMNGPQRSAFVRRFLAGLAALTALYMLLTAYRDFRDNFAAELWAALGYADDASVFALSELPIALVVLVGLALVYRITDNRRALLVIHGMMGLGTLLIALATALFDLGLLSGFQWMLAIGLGLYLGYVPYGCVLFDRLIATTRTVGTAVFMIYVTDAFGYVGSIGVLTVKNFFALDVSWLAFFRGFSYLTGWICTGAFAFSAWYFARVTRTGRVAT